MRLIPKKIKCQNCGHVLAKKLKGLELMDNVTVTSSNPMYRRNSVVITNKDKEYAVEKLFIGLICPECHCLVQIQGRF